MSNEYEQAQLLQMQKEQIMINQQKQQSGLQGSYETQDVIPSYGSIIKELTDTEKMLKHFELRLRGKKEDENGNIISDLAEGEEPRMKTDRAVKDFMEIIRGIVNKHTDFSYYSVDEGFSLIEGANYTICRWLMLQGEEVPLRYRYKISFEALCLIYASIHKAIDGKMLKWTKGSFSEGMHTGNIPQKKGLMDTLMFWNKKGG